MHHYLKLGPNGLHTILTRHIKLYDRHEIMIKREIYSSVQRLMRIARRANVANHDQQQADLAL
jgi:hypothetical protein